MIAAINNQSIVMVAIGCAAILVSVASSSRYRSSLPSYVVTVCGLMILAFGLKDGSHVLAILGVAIMAASAIIWYTMGGAKNL